MGISNKFNFDIVQKRIKNLDVSLPLANTAKNHFLQNFTKQSFDGKNWAKRKKETKKTQGKNILIGTGKLRKDVANSVDNGNKISNKSFTLVVKNNYAIYHNDGTNKMPKRQFVGTDDKLNKKLENKLNQLASKIWEI